MGWVWVYMYGVLVPNLIRGHTLMTSTQRGMSPVQMDACGPGKGVYSMWTSTQREPTEVMLSSHAKKAALFLDQNFWASCFNFIFN